MSQPRGLFSKFKALDAYPKPADDFFTKTLSGGIVTLVASVVMALLFVNELRLYLVTVPVHELVVDTSLGEQISINVDVTFPRMPCSWLSLDAMDISGDVHLDVDHNVYKQRLDKRGGHIGQAELHDVHSTKTVDPKSINETVGGCLSCYGAEDEETKCCNTCDEIRVQYRKKGWAMSNLQHFEQCTHDHYFETITDQEGEGCRMWGKLEVNKVAGNFHFAPGRSYQQGPMHVHDLAPFTDKTLDFNHVINKLSFGHEYPGMHNPLDGARGGPRGSAVSRLDPIHLLQAGGGAPAMGMFQYFLKVVPTVYKDLWNNTIASNQYSVTENYRDSITGPQRSLPGLFFFYDLSPIKVKISEHKASFLHFLTNVCAIVGGVFTVAGIVDATIYHGQRAIKKKMELGKFT